MKAVWLVTSVCALGCVAFVGQAFQSQTTPSQTPPTQAESARDNSRIILDVTRVNMLFTVTDKKGRFVTDLAEKDFEVFESKKKQTIQQFTAESDLPLRLAILIDTSNSIRERFRFEQEAASSFIKGVVRRGEDKAMIVSFDTNAELVTDLTDQVPELNKGIMSLRPGGGTAFYDAIYFASREKLSKDQPRDKFRRAIIIMTDGEDNQSRVTRDQALEMAQKADAVIYAISTNITHVETEGDKVLRYLTEQTGGQAFFPFKVEDLEQSFENIANELRHQYNIFYRPDPLRTDGLYHAVQLKVKDRKDYVVRARKGYYAPKL
jgi:Ca-activated chloride channel family protein